MPMSVPSTQTAINVTIRSIRPNLRLIDCTSAGDLEQAAFWSIRATSVNVPRPTVWVNGSSTTCAPKEFVSAPADRVRRGAREKALPSKTRVPERHSSSPPWDQGRDISA